MGQSKTALMGVPICAELSQDGGSAKMASKTRNKVSMSRICGCPAGSLMYFAGTSHSISLKSMYSWGSAMTMVLNSLTTEVDGGGFALTCWTFLLIQLLNEALSLGSQPPTLLAMVIMSELKCYVL